MNTMTSSSLLRRMSASCVALILGVCLAAPSALAEERTTVIIFTPALTTTTTTGVVFTVVDSTTSTTSSTRDILFGSKDATTTYMAQNNTAIKQSLTVGDGEAMDDLAHMAQIAPSDLDAFKAVLRSQREPLIELLSTPDFGEAQAMAATRLIVDAMRQDAMLEHYVSS